ncbi:50S ribosomal protein L1, mitochondrial, putative [Plasmodium knowlesi strain H]|uniref:50S ribosomal protein L1, mitochondrial, putative n=3 Tax=Plasmodium knowlesi TaxID=5850 RepID=A0A5K1ULN8_PLAKH|nr:50S ribosomal protein L1, mitochondrial, putative [Plasmodium knowlesi strain H]OTN68720.1 putative 50S ribosomal protein L1 - mitochondrial [Plasmodium knowlesi]CAA9986176.1 50S ribosomal protein L1, mitochondrial, putative [Plasmodium knowlesi strain H]SBO25373.1 50S ribosomal protein L1, mitochondrial, putative [Plasmodium knowlesi strain H]SBO27670.1 50S ribosomal protein L1, mitochondrial, putative [Plasmodium knowlesi strain H]VVS75650.1 50S ribosomal protein L1, mitochondrial, putati|eukprot:XP_002257587.1 50S ribosomal protein L1, putative [Plasmodium knowlesi strain H]
MRRLLVLQPQVGKGGFQPKEPFSKFRRWKKYIPFYDVKKRHKQRTGSEEINEVENINASGVTKSDTQSSWNEHINGETNQHLRCENLVPPISPMKGLKLLLSCRHVQSRYHDKSDDASPMESTGNEEKINFNLIIKIDIKRESLRGMCNLPHSVDRNKKILVLVDEDHQSLKKAGADYVGLEYINRIKNGWLDFHICLSDFKNINKILPVAKILGPKKLMPNVKSNTLVHNLVDAILSIKSGNRIEYRSEQVDAETFDLFNHIYQFRNVHLGSIANLSVNIASTEMNPYDTLENIKCFVTEILKCNVHSSHMEKDAKVTFTWPPITCKRKKKKMLHLQGGNPLLLGGDQNSESFILGAYVTVPGIPKIFLHPQLLLPHSDGYSV